MFSKTLAIVMAVFVSGFATTVHAQGQEWSQATACPGWNNPNNFTAGGAVINKWSGAGVCVGSSKPCPNPLTGEPGAIWIGNGPSWNYTNSQLSTIESPNPYQCSNIPNVNKQFLIVNDVTGHDGNTANHLPYVPTHFNTIDTTGGVSTNLTHSIRIGDGCASGNSSNGYGGAQLNYTMRVTPDNAMLYLYYSIVAQAPTHGQQGNPTFIIRVMKRNNANNWVQISDTLAYYISTTPASNTSDPCANIDYITPIAQGQTGWHTGVTSPTIVYYKDWEKVCINLDKYLYDTLQVQVIVYDCEANYHYAYGYIAGECRSMTIRQSGCPAGLSTNVTTLTAPSGLKDYEWYASEYGVIDPAINFGPGEENGYVTWRSLRAPTDPSPNPNGFTYNVKAADFRVTRRLVNSMPMVIDSMGNLQTFRCRMTSAMDPNKPFDSYLYVKVQNTKPTMDVDSLLMCDGTAKLWNKSYVPGDPTLMVDSATQWSFYNNPNALGDPLAVFTGDSAQYQYSGHDLRSVRVRSFTTDPSCYSDAIYRLQPRWNPEAGMTITKRVLCDADETTLTDTTSGLNNSRIWRFRSATAEDEDMSLTDTLTGSGSTNRIITRSFTHAVEPIELLVRNGLYYLNPTNASERIWCQTLVRDTVSVFLHPELAVEGDTVVCEGTMTDATVRAIGVDSCIYEWSTQLGSITGGLPSGPRLQVTPYADTATYFVRVTSPQNCVAWDSIHAYVVRPKLTMLPTDGRVCPGVPAVLFGSDADHFSWTAMPEDSSLLGQETNDTIRVTPEVTTTYTMVGHGSNDCDATPLTSTVTIMPLPVPAVALNPEMVDAENPKVILRDVSQYGVASSWLFNDGSTAEGREVTHVFEHSEGLDSVAVTLTSYNVLNCPTVYPFAIPVSNYTAWFPTVFTPGSSDGNNLFSLYTINEYQYFHIYIYNRRGELVFESDDVHFTWDGTYNNEPCPQGAYVYVCRYRKPGTTTLSTMTGTISLIR